MSARVALVASGSTDDGAGVLASRLRHLLGAGWDARLVAKSDPWGDSPVLRAPDLRDQVDLAATPERRLRRLRPDLVHFHSASAAWRALGERRLRDARFIVGVRGDGRDLALPDPEALWTRADRLVFPHDAALARALAQGYPAEKAEVLLPPQVPANGHVARESPGGVLRVLSAGPLIWEQGYEHSIHAIRLLADAGVRCDYRLIGDGDHVQAVAFARHQLGLHDEVRLVTPNGGDPLAEALAETDIFLDPAVTDTTSTVALLSAMGRGIPFVATARRPALPEGAGVVVPRRDPRAIAEALARLARDRELRAGMGATARRAAAAAPEPDHFARLEALYRSTLAGYGP